MWLLTALKMHQRMRSIVKRLCSDTAFTFSPSGESWACCSFRTKKKRKRKEKKETFSAQILTFNHRGICIFIHFSAALQGAEESDTNEVI